MLAILLVPQCCETDAHHPERPDVDHGREALACPVAAEQEFVATLAAAEPIRRRQLTLDLYKRVIDGVAELGFPLSIHLEAAYGTNKAAFDTFAELLAYWSPS